MLAVVGEIGTGVRIRVARLADRPLDPEPEIDSPAFLKALQDGPPVAERAFRDLVVRLRPSLLRYLGRWLRDAEEAEDAFQETCLALHHGLPTYRGPGRLTTWVYSLARHKVREMVSEKYGSGGEDGIPGLPAEELAATDPAPDEAAHQSLLLAWIRSAADTLPAIAASQRLTNNDATEPTLA